MEKGKIPQGGRVKRMKDCGTNVIRKSGLFVWFVVKFFFAIMSFSKTPEKG
jgi:hypothetical protein